MKSKILALLLSICLLFSMTATAFAAKTQKITVTAEKTTVYKAASTSSEKLLTVKKGYTFTAVSSTKSFWKVEFKKKNDSKTYTGYVLKKDTKESASTSSGAAIPSWAKTYYDFFSNDFSIGQVPMFLNEKRWIHSNNGTKLVLSDVYFAQIKGYDYPVLILGECTIDDSFYWMLPYIIKNGKLTNPSEKEYKTLVTYNKDGFPEINGKVLAEFDCHGYDSKGVSSEKQLNEDMQKVLDWLKKQK